MPAQQKTGQPVHSTVTASVFSGSGGGACGGLQTHPNSFAELSNNYAGPGQLDFAALGNLACGTPVTVTYKGKSLTLTKQDKGAGGPGIGGYPRAIDIFAPAARTLGISGLALVQVDIGVHHGGTQGGGGTGVTANSTGKFYVNATSGTDTDYWTALNNWAQQANWYVFTDGEIIYIADSYILGQQTPVAIIGPLIGTQEPDQRAMSFGGTLDNTSFQYFVNHKRRKRYQRKTEMAKVQSPTQLLIDYTCPIDAFRAGDLVQLVGAGPFDGPWLIGNCIRSAFNIYSELTLVPMLQPIVPGTTVAAANAQSRTKQPPTAAEAYTNPFERVQGLFAGRIDAGVDFAASSGQPILALGDYELTFASNKQQGWPGGGHLCFKLTNGPYKGKFIYYGENLTPTAPIGKTGKAGDVLATFKNTAPETGIPSNKGGIEIGWAADASGYPLGFKLNQYAKGKDPGAQITAAGMSFENLLLDLGCPQASNFGGQVHGKMPPGYP